MNRIKNEDFIAQAGAIAALLEVSGYPKPGNVHRTQNFQDTHYEHFLISSVAIIPILRNIASQGKRVMNKEILLNELNLGAAILNAVKSTQLWQSAGNTNLGIILLFVPLACAAGMLIDHPNPSLLKLRNNLDLIIQNSTPTDTVKLYEAIHIADPGGLGKVTEFDINGESSEDLLRKNINLFDVFKISADRDSIAREWITKFQITFELGLPYFSEIFKKTSDINVSVVHTYLKILGAIPDTLIARKYGKPLAKRISTRAKHILNQGGLLSKKQLLWQFDLELRNKQKINPGTSADLTASTIMVALLEGIKF